MSLKKQTNHQGYVCFNCLKEAKSHDVQFFYLFFKKLKFFEWLQFPSLSNNITKRATA